MGNTKVGGVYVVFKGCAGRKSLIQPEGSGRASHIDIQEKNILGQGNDSAKTLRWE